MALYAMVEMEERLAMHYQLSVAEGRGDGIESVFAQVPQHPAAELGSAVDDVRVAMHNASARSEEKDVD